MAFPTISEPMQLEEIQQVEGGNLDNSVSLLILITKSTYFLYFSLIVFQNQLLTITNMIPLVFHGNL